MRPNLLCELPDLTFHISNRPVGFPSQRFEPKTAIVLSCNGWHSIPWVTAIESKPPNVIILVGLDFVADPGSITVL